MKTKLGRMVEAVSVVALLAFGWSEARAADVMVKTNDHRGFTTLTDEQGSCPRGAAEYRDTVDNHVLWEVGCYTVNTDGVFVLTNHRGAVFLLPAHTFYRTEADALRYGK